MLYESNHHSNNPEQRQESNSRPSRLSLVIASKHVLVAEGIQALLCRAGYRFIKVVHDAKQLELILGSNPASVLVIGIEFLTSEFHGLRAFQKHFPMKRTMVTCTVDQLSTGTCCLPESIGAIVSINQQFSNLVNALNAIQQGKRYVDTELSEAWNQRCRQPRLDATHRQVEIISHVANGKSSRQIASMLGLSRKTIDNHRTRIRQRMGVKSSAEMVNVAKQNGWI